MGFWIPVKPFKRTYFGQLKKNLEKILEITSEKFTEFYGY